MIIPKHFGCHLESQNVVNRKYMLYFPKAEIKIKWFVVITYWAKRKKLYLNFKPKTKITLKQEYVVQIKHLIAFV